MQRVVPYLVLLLGCFFGWYSRAPSRPPVPPAPPRIHCPSDFKDSVKKLREAFDEHLFGQHLARRTILGAIDGHLTNPNPQKPLVLSLHGPAGTGKNHVSRLIIESLFPPETRNRDVTVQTAHKDYPNLDELDKYKRELVSLVTSRVSPCPRHVFIFDEVDSMPAGLLDSISSYLDHHDELGGITVRKAIFIFRSNLASQDINKHVFEQYEKGIPREQITLPDMEKVITKAVSQASDAGGFYKSRIISSHLVSHFVPFLPLEEAHVMKCVHAEFKNRGEYHHVTTEVVETIVAELPFDTPVKGSAEFSVKGCKNVAEKVSIILYQLKSKREDL